MAVIGTAYVEIRALTQNVSKDLDKAFNSAGLGSFAGRIALLGPLLAEAAGGISALASGLFSMGAAAAPAVASLAAIPGILAAILQGAGAVAIAFGGISKALSAGIASQSGAGASAGKTASAVASAAKAIERAQDSLTQTIRRNAESQMLADRAVADAEVAYAEVRKQTADAIRDARLRQADAEQAYQKALRDQNEDAIKAQEDLAKANREVEDARLDQIDRNLKAQQTLDNATAARDKASTDNAKKERTNEEGVTKAINDAAKAQLVYTAAQAAEAKALQNVTDATNAIADAREKATDRIRDLQTAIAGGVVDEEKATQKLEDATKHLQEVQELPVDNRLRKNAQIAYDEAVNNLKKVQNANSDLKQEQEAVNKTGVEGSEEVVTATQKQQDAQDKYTDAVQKTKEAKQDSADADQTALDKRADADQAALDDAAELKRLTDAISQATTDQAKTKREAQEAYDDAQIKSGDLARSIAEQTIQDEAAIVKAKREKNQADQAYAEATLDRSTKLIKARRDEQDAEREQADTRLDNALSLKQAQQALADAKKSADAAGSAGASGINAFQQALDKLSPAAREFVLYLLSIQDKLKELRAAAGEELFPKLETSLKTILSGPFFPALVIALRETGSAMGDLAVKGANLISSPAFSSEFAKVAENNAKVLGPLGDALLNLIDGFVHLLGAAGPLTLRFAEFLKSTTGVGAELIKTGEATGRLQKFFDRAGDSAAQLGRIVSNLVTAIFHVGSASAPAGQSLLDSFEDATKKLSKLTGTKEAKKQLDDFFQGVAINVRAIGDLFNAIFLLFAKLGDNPGLKAFADGIRTQLLPPLESLLNSGVDKFGGLLVTLATSVAKLFDALSGSPAIKIFVTIISSAIDILTKFVSNNTSFVFAITSVLAAFKAFSLIAGILLPIVSAIAQVALALARFVVFGNPVLVVIAALAVAFAILYTKNKAFHDFVNTKVVPVLITIAKVVKDSVITAFHAFIDFITNTLVPGVQHFLVPIIAAVRDVFSEIGDAIRSNSASFAKVGALFKSLGNSGLLQATLSKVADVLSGVVLPVLTKFASIIIKIYQEYLILLIKGFGALVVQIIETIAFFIDFIDNVIKGMKLAVSTVSKGISDIIGFFTSLGTKVKNNDIFKFVETAIKKAVDFVSDSVDNVVKFFTGLEARIHDAEVKAFDAIISAITSVASTVSTKVDAVVGFVTGIGARVLAGVGDLFGPIGSGISAAATSVSTSVTSIIGYVTGIGAKIVASGVDLFGWIATKIGEALAEVKRVITAIESVVNGIRKDLIDGAVDLFQFIVTKIKDAASSVSDKVGDIVGYVTGIADRIKRGAGAIFGWVGEKITDAYNDVKDGVDKIVGLFGDGKGGLKSLFNAVSNPFTALVGFFRSVLNDLIALWNRLDFKISVPKSVFGIPVPGGGSSISIGTPNLPFLAQGGTVAATKGGVLAVIGEGGRDERVTPLNANGLSSGEQAILDALNALTLLLTGNNKTVDITNNVYPSAGLDEREIALSLSRRMAYDIGIAG